MPIVVRMMVLLTLAALPIPGRADDVPRVLIIGDGVHNDIFRAATSQLEGRAELVFASVPKGEVLNTTTALEHLDTLLGDGSWDVVHFNCGLGDLVYRAPGMESFRVMPIHAGGVRTTSPERYEANLRELVRRFQETGAVLVWASTTPIRHSTTNVFQMESEIEYNVIAARIMAQEGVAVNDMHSYVLGQIDMDRPASHGADPFFFDRRPIHRRVVNAVLEALGLPLDSIEPPAEGS